MALGGWENIREIESCITRIRVTVVSPDVVDDAALRHEGAFDVITVASTIQIVVGPDADRLVDEIKALR